MPNSRFYTSADVKNLFDYALTKIDFTVPELTRDTACTHGLDLLNDQYITKIIQEISMKTYAFEDQYNSHDWVKILKHVFQNGQIINYQNIEVFKEWKEFSTYSRNIFMEKEKIQNSGNGGNVEKAKEYVLELKKFMAKLIHHGTVEEINCIHSMLNLANTIFTQDITKVNTSEKVAHMLGGVFYDGLQLEGIVKSFTFFEIDSIQSKEYMQRIHKCSSFLKEVIEDSLFSQDFNKFYYVQYLATPKLEIEPDKGSEKKYTRNKRSYSLECTSTLDPEFIKKFQELSVVRCTRTAPERLERNATNTSNTTLITFSYSNGQKMLPCLKEMNASDVTESIPHTKAKKRLSINSIFEK